MADHCDAPHCPADARMTFVVAPTPPPIPGRPWRFAGRDWQPGDQIHLCPPHGVDVYRTVGATDPSQVAEWLRPDAADPPNTWRPPPPRTAYTRW